jgi:hypothetical protein
MLFEELIVGFMIYIFRENEIDHHTTLVLAKNKKTVWQQTSEKVQEI